MIQPDPEKPSGYFVKIDVLIVSVASAEWGLLMLHLPLPKTSEAG
jgi:hypothetical protein